MKIAALEAPFEPKPVRTAMMQVGAAGDSTIAVDGNRVDWTIQNIGRKSLVVRSVALDAPGTNGELVALAQNGVTLSTRRRIDDNGILGLRRLEPQMTVASEDAFTLSFTFADGALHGPR